MNLTDAAPAGRVRDGSPVLPAAAVVFRVIFAIVKRETVLKAVKEFPEEVDLDRLFERLLFIRKMEAGLVAADEGRKLGQTEVEVHFKRKWRK